MRHTKDTSSVTSAKTLRGAAAAHTLTTQDRRNGALRINEVRRKKREEARKTAMDTLVEKFEAHADEILDTYLSAIRVGD